MKIELEKNLRVYLPSLFQLIEGNFSRKEWKAINKKFEGKFSELKLKYENGDRPKPKLNIYTLLSSWLNQEMHGIVFRNYLDNLIKDLTILLNTQEKQAIKKKNLFNLLLFEKDFLNYVGELSVLNNLMSTGVYRLLAIEFTVKKGGKGIDFRLLNVNENKEVLVEVVNIELTDTNSSSNEKIELLLLSKLNGKLSDKDKSGILDYKLIPVLWYEKVDNVKRVKEFYETQEFHIERCETPRAYVWFRINQKKFINKFGAINTVLS